MTPSRNEKLWTPYIDNELSVSESLAFEQSLSSADRRRLDAEKRLEAALGPRLAAGCDCPDELWQSLREQLGSKPDTGRTAYRRVWRGMAVLAAAALILVGAAQLWSVFAPGVSPPGGIPATVAELARLSETPATPEAVQAFLDRNAVPWTVQAFPFYAEGSHHRVELVGAAMMPFEDEPVPTVLMSCCGEPAEVVIAREGSPAAARLRERQRDGDVQEVRALGGYVGGVLSLHPSHDVLDALGVHKT